MELLEDLCKVHSPTGEEFRMKEFLLNYVDTHSKKWKVKPIVVKDNLQDALMLVFGQPSTVIFAHMDTIGFTTRYQNELVPIGSPEVRDGFKVVGSDPLGEIECKLKVDEEGSVTHDFPRAIARGTSLRFKPVFRLKGDFITSPYLDNRMGIYAALKVAETLEHGVIAFGTHEEHGGGNVPVILKYLMENHPVRHALISDITWVTDGVTHGKGVVISMRDRNIPRKTFIDKVLGLAEKSGISYQIEVEGSGSSDAREVQQSPYPIDWCFVGAPEDNVHSPEETVHLADLQAMIEMHKYLIKAL